MNQEQLNDILHRRGGISPEEVYSLVAEVIALQEQREQARAKAAKAVNCIIKDAVGFEHITRMPRGTYERPERRFILPVLARRGSLAPLGPGEYPIADVYKTREYEMVGRRPWDGLPIYEEQT
jgi:hypothetical protein